MTVFYTTFMEKLKWPRLFSIFFVICLAACHSGKNSSFDKDIKGEEAEMDEIRRPLAFPWSDLDLFQDQFNQLECENCPSSFGQLLVKKKVIERDSENIEITGHCQGSLIYEDVFLTARHCLPENVVSPGDSCENNIKVILPRVSADKPLEILECDQLIDVSKTFGNLTNDKTQPDWAILKLKTLSDRFLKPDGNFSRGITDNESLFGFLPLKNPKTGELSITQLECKAIQNSLTLPEFFQSKGPLALLQCDSPAVYGFSGMTLFRLENQKYFPVGTLSHIVETRSLKKDHLEVSFSKKIVVSQIICMNNNNPPPFCEFDPDKRKDHEQAIYKKSLKRSKNEIDKELEKWIKSKDRPIKWQFVNSGNWKNLPEPYLAYFNRNFERFQKSFEDNGEIGIYYLQNLIPVYPECVHKKFVHNRKSVSGIPVQIPVVGVSLSKMEQKRIVTYYDITPLEARLVLNGHHSAGLMTASRKDGKFIIRFTSEKPQVEFPGQPIISQQFLHLFAEIPLCP